MPTRRPEDRAFRPRPEGLEGRLMLSRMISGTDVDGDTWTLKLVGPGVLDVRDRAGNAPQRGQRFLMDTITLAATQSEQTRLIGTVRKSATGDGKVFFRHLVSTGGGERFPMDPSQGPEMFPPRNGIHVIDMPAFWLGDTDPGGAPLRPASNPFDTEGLFNYPVVAGIDIPQGVNTLRFGGVDVTYTPPGEEFPPTSENQRGDLFEVDLGVPWTQGTNIIVDQIISSAEFVSDTRQFQDAVAINVAGRLNVFQANAIQGNSVLPPGQFLTADATTRLPGGTILTSGSGVAPFGPGATGEQDFPDDPLGRVEQFGLGTTGGGLPGQIGYIRIGGDATNFTAIAFDSSGIGGEFHDFARITNFAIGGETNNVLMIAPGGSRFVQFGKGMDKVTINAEAIGEIRANRGAIDSNVTVSRHINRVTFGGDVIKTNVITGYNQNFGDMVTKARINGQPTPSLINRVATASIAGQESNSDLHTLNPPFQPIAAAGGFMTALIAGDVIDSIFSASVEPNPPHDTSRLPGTFDRQGPSATVFGQNNLVLPRGRIHAKVEGQINNSGLVAPAEIPEDTDLLHQVFVTPQARGRAFFAENVQVKRGPVIPPKAPQPPYPHGRFTPPRALRHSAKVLQPAPKTTEVPPGGPLSTDQEHIG